MPDAVVVAIAKAVTSELAGAALSQPFAPVLSYGDWAKPFDDQLVETSSITVDVLPVTMQQTAELQSYTELRYLVPIDIAIRQRFGEDAIDQDTGRVAIDRVHALMLLVQDVHELFAAKELADLPSATWKSTKILVAPVIKHLREDRQFTGIVRVTYRMEHTPRT